MKSTGSRPGGRSARVRQAVFAAALALLDDGQVEPSLPEVAERAGVASSSLYRRWGSWENLMAEALLDQSEVNIPVPDTGALRSDLIEFAEAMATFLAAPRVVGLVRALAVVERTPELDRARTQFWDERFRLASVMVERGIERGELAADTDARFLLEMVVAPLHLRQSLLGGDPAAMIHQQVDLILNGSGRTQ